MYIIINVYIIDSLKLLAILNETVLNSKLFFVIAADFYNFSSFRIVLHEGKVYFSVKIFY